MASAVAGTVKLAAGSLASGCHLATWLLKSWTTIPAPAPSTQITNTIASAILGLLGVNASNEISAAAMDRGTVAALPGDMASRTARPIGPGKTFAPASALPGA